MKKWLRKLYWQLLARNAGQPESPKFSEDDKTRRFFDPKRSKIR